MQHTCALCYESKQILIYKYYYSSSFSRLSLCPLAHWDQHTEVREGGVKAICRWVQSLKGKLIITAMSYGYSLLSPPKSGIFHLPGVVHEDHFQEFPYWNKFRFNVYMHQMKPRIETEKYMHKGMASVHTSNQYMLIWTSFLPATFK